MIIVNKMFAEKIIRYHENMNRWMRAIISFPKIGEGLRRQLYENNNKFLKNTIGALAQIVEMIREFLTKLVFVFVFVYIPYLIMALACPLIKTHQELAIIYLFFMLSTLSGSLSNTTILSMDDRDYLMIRVFMINPYLNFMGKLIYKLFSDYIYFSIVLMIFGVSPYKSFILSFVTMCARPIGELFVLFVYYKLRKLHEYRSTYNGFVMAMCVIVAYFLPFLNRSISEEWYLVTNIGFGIIMFVLGAIAMFLLSRYKNYNDIMREAMHIKHDY